MAHEEFITVEQAAKLSGLSRRQIQHLLKTGAVEATKPGRDWLVRRSAVVEYLKRDRKPGPKSKLGKPKR